MARGRCHAAPLRGPEPCGRASAGCQREPPRPDGPVRSGREEGGEGGGKRWLVDVGLGDGPPYPLALAPGTYAQEGFEFRLRPSPLVAAGWRLDHDPRGAFILVDFAAEPVTTAAFESMHTTLSTSPESGFVRTAAVLRRPAGGPEMLRGCVFSEWGGDRMRERDVDSAADWWDLVLGRFGLAYADLTASERDGLWQKVRSTHEAWDAAGRP